MPTWTLSDSSKNSPKSKDSNQANTQSAALQLQQTESKPGSSGLCPNCLELLQMGEKHVCARYVKRAKIERVKDCYRQLVKKN